MLFLAGLESGDQAVWQDVTRSLPFRAAECLANSQARDLQQKLCEAVRAVAS